LVYLSRIIIIIIIIIIQGHEELNEMPAKGERTKLLVFFEW
jgi:hypothetical protein